MKHQKKIISTGKHLQFVQEKSWEYIERIHSKGVVVIAAITDAQEIIFVEQYRIPVQSLTIEMPAGLVGDEQHYADEDVFHAAYRELLEETGFEALNFETIITGPASSGITNEIHTFLCATGLKKVGKGGGTHHENITVYQIPLIQVSSWLDKQQSEGKLVDPKILAALYYVHKRFGISV